MELQNILNNQNNHGRKKKAGVIMLSDFKLLQNHSN